MRLSEKCSSKSMTNILMHFKYDNIYMNIDRFEISLDVGKYIEYYCEKTRSTLGINRSLNLYMLIKMIAAYQ